MTKKFVRDGKMFTFNVIVGAFLSSVLAILWTLDPMNSADEAIRHFFAKIVIVGSFLMIIAEIIVARIYGHSGSQLSTRICFSIIKPLIMLNGHTFQVALVNLNIETACDNVNSMHRPASGLEGLGIKTTDEAIFIHSGNVLLFAGRAVLV